MSTPAHLRAALEWLPEDGPPSGTREEVAESLAKLLAETEARAKENQIMPLSELDALAQFTKEAHARGYREGLVNAKAVARKPQPLAAIQSLLDKRPTT